MRSAKRQIAIDRGHDVPTDTTVYFSPFLRILLSVEMLTCQIADDNHYYDSIPKHLIFRFRWIRAARARRDVPVSAFMEFSLSVGRMYLAGERSQDVGIGSVRKDWIRSRTIDAKFCDPFVVFSFHPGATVKPRREVGICTALLWVQLASVLRCEIPRLFAKFPTRCLVPQNVSRICNQSSNKSSKNCRFTIH